MRLIRLFQRHLLNLLLDKRTYFRVISLSLFLTSINTPLFARAKQLANTNTSDIEKKQDEEAKKPYKRIKEVGGEVIIDGSLRVLEGNEGKFFELVEISTPVTPAANNARIFLRSDPTNKQTLVILYDDGTTDSIATNQ